MDLLLQIQRDISRYDRNNFARLMNSTITHSATPIEPLYNVQNQLIHNFPPTAAHVRALTGAEIDVLLNALGLPLNGLVEVRRARLSRHVGLIAI
ncbi:hypothetical protein BGX38DRAFT_1085245 [Terfezia claveryi]|nr:hypothetical protein BGX38DRAFT_1085245 [Terfezia claveryi]